VVTRYKQILLTSLKEDRLEAHVQTLASEVKIQLTKTQQEEYEAIDKAATEYKRHAETKCRKLHAGAIQWCPQVSCTTNWILYWKGLLSCKQGCAIGSSVLRAQAKKAGIEQHATNFNLVPQIIQDKIQDAYKRFNQLKADPDR